MLTKDFTFEIKAVDEATGTFEGFASVYNVVDSYGDTVLPGAFARTLQEKGGEIVILNQHDTRDPIGLGVLEDSAVGLKINGQLNLDVRAAQEAYSNLKKRILKGLSIGYMVRADEYDRQTQIRKLTDIELMEVSLVTFQACPGALVTGVKNARDVNSIRDFEGVLRDVGFSQREAKALASGGWKALQRDAEQAIEEDGQKAAATEPDINTIAALLQAHTNQINSRRLTWKTM